MKRIAVLLAVACSGAFAQDTNVIKPISQESLNAFTKTMLTDDLAGYIKGHDTLIGESIPDVTASKLISDYQANELSADKKYKDKPVRIKTVASAIKSDIGGRGFIVANGANAYSHVYLYVDENDERILSLNKGSQVDLICYGNGMTLNTPILSPCVFTGDFAKTVSGHVEKSIARASEVNYQPRSVIEVFLIFTYKLYEPKIADPCLRSPSECLKAYASAAKSLEEGKGDISVDTMQALRKEAIKYKDLPPLPVDKKTALLKLLE